MALPPDAPSPDRPAPTPLLSTDRVLAGPDTSATEGRVRWAPARSLFAGGMTLAALLLAPFHVTPGAVALFLVATAVTIGAGHSVGMHRLLIHRAFSTSPALRNLLVYLGTLVGMAGPMGMVRLHDTRDWAQRQAACHDLHAHRAPMWRDAWWQMHCRLDLTHPPRFVPEPAIADDPVLRFLERTWILQQVPPALLFLAIGGLPWLVWGTFVRVAVSLTGHWLVGHLTHRRGPRAWVVDGAAVQGHDLPAAAWITFGEAWHGNHHAFPGSARLGVLPGQPDPGWWFLLALRRLGLAWDLRQPADLPPRPGLRRLPRASARRPGRPAGAPLPEPLA